jgi:hypothetical protein
MPHNNLLNIGAGLSPALPFSMAAEHGAYKQYCTSCLLWRQLLRKTQEPELICRALKFDDLLESKTGSTDATRRAVFCLLLSLFIL